MPNHKLQVEFDDGRTVIYDVEEDIRELGAFAPLQTERGLFESVQIDESRSCVYWNDEIDLPSDIIYEYGQTI